MLDFNDADMRVIKLENYKPSYNRLAVFEKFTKKSQQTLTSAFLLITLLRFITLNKVAIIVFKIQKFAQFNYM